MFCAIYIRSCVYQSDYLLVLEILNQILHVPEFSVQSALIVDQAVQLPPQVGNVSLEHGADVAGLGGGLLVLQKIPFCLQNFVLLFQESHLLKKQQGNFIRRSRQCKTLAHHLLQIGIELRSSARMTEQNACNSNLFSCV